MPWKLLAFTAVIALVLVFVGFNLDNRCDISIALFTFSDVPVVITILAAYLLGLLSAFFLAVGKRARTGPRVSAAPAPRVMPAEPERGLEPPSQPSSQPLSQAAARKKKRS